MKRLLALLLAILCACAPSAGESQAPAPSAETESQAPAETASPSETAQTDAELTADAIARAIVDSQPEPERFAARMGEDLEFSLSVYGVGDYFLRDAAVYTASGVDAREIAVLRLDSMNNDFSDVAAALEEYRQNREADFFGYVPEQALLVENGAVVGGWGCVALLLCEDMEKAEAAFEASAGTQGETGVAFQGLPPAETRWFTAYDPPNKFDMSLYDTTAVREAWRSGEAAGLGEKDAAILAKCREAMGEVVRDGMTDLEKEAALHSWLMEHGEYDETVRDPRTPLGREDNNNPYGLLVNGYGICLGYASSFQLLMELAGVECITVVGASKESREDHAWNMVKLEGDWYCVDPTWNLSFWKNGRGYGYFNVTSQKMRDTNHQWDYRNVPEATATRFHWDGTGPLPQ